MVHGIIPKETTRDGGAINRGASTENVALLTERKSKEGANSKLALDRVMKLGEAAEQFDERTSCTFLKFDRILRLEKGTRGIRRMDLIIPDRNRSRRRLGACDQRNREERSHPRPTRPKVDRESKLEEGTRALALRISDLIRRVE